MFFKITEHMSTIGEVFAFFFPRSSVHGRLEDFYRVKLLTKVVCAAVAIDKMSYARVHTPASVTRVLLLRGYELQSSLIPVL